MGALFFVLPRLERLLAPADPLGQALGQRQPGDRLGQGARLEQQALLSWRSLIGG